MSEASAPATARRVPRIDGERLWADIQSTSRIGALGETGLSRLALSDSDRDVRDWFASECRALGCTVECDSIGNLFATYPGSDDTCAPIAVGSHLDSQPGGGRFDGVLGVLAGIEVLRALRDASVRMKHPLTIVDWTNEEGSRFAPAMMGSGVYSGTNDLAAMERVADRAGVTVREALERIGYRGPLAPGHLRFAAYLELHIEQGPVLEAAQCQLGAVTAIQGVRWLDVTVTGVESHAGSQPMSLRNDALVLASRIVLATQACAAAYPPGVATVGSAVVAPNSRNVVPGRVQLEIDLRHPDAATLHAMEEGLTGDIHAIAPEASVRAVWRREPTPFDAALLAVIRDEARALGYSVMDIVSGGGHDAGHVATVAPTAMLFIPSQGGLSHNVLEFSTPAQCTSGAEALLATVLRLDRTLGTRAEL